MEIENKGDPGDLPVLSSLPDRGVTDEMIESLDDSDTIEKAFPLAGYPETTIRTHFALSRGDAHYFVGWDPEDTNWTVIVKVEEDEKENEDELIEFGVSALRKLDDSGAVLTAPFDYIDESDEGDSGQILQSVLAAVAEYGRVAYDRANEQPPEFYTDKLDDSDFV
jgi:hypothetical protein